ncbi:MAG: type II toxin-antitoxin system VapC family toxin [Candidatus Bathyarchaeia archaeon]
MEVRFIDSNIFYYHLVQDKTYGPNATGIIGRVRDGEPAATSVIVVSELMSLFEFRILQIHRRDDLSSAQKALLIKRFESAMSSFYDLITSLVHLDKLGCAWDEALEAFVHMLDYGLDFNDALNVAVMKRNNIQSLYSLDKAFDRVPWLKRRSG